MDTALPQKFPFILDRNLAKANCTGNRVCTSCDIVVPDFKLKDKGFSPAKDATSEWWWNSTVPQPLALYATTKRFQSQKNLQTTNK